MWKKKFIHVFGLLLSNCLFTAVPEEKILELIADGCVEPIEAKQQAPSRAFPENCFPRTLDKKLLSLPLRILNWGSNGRAGHPWQFENPRCNQFYFNLHARIARSHADIRLSPHDLFHAHLVSYGALGDRLLMVFHAKEYPRDLETIKNYYQSKKEKFSTNSPSYQARNFIYLSHLNNGYEIYQVHKRGACEGLFSRWGMNQLAEKKLMKLVPKPHALGDVNVFMPDNLGRIKYNFYKDEEGRDQEGMHSGKNVVFRQRINFEMDAWLLTQGSAPIVYFLTGF